MTNGYTRNPAIPLFQYGSILKAVENIVIPIYRCARSDPMEIIPTQASSAHLLRRRARSLKQLLKKRMMNESHLAGQEDMTAEPSGSWVDTEKTANVAIDTLFSKTFNDSEDLSSEKLAPDLSLFLTI